MANICDAALHLCRIRATRLTSLGTPAPGPNNVYVSDKPIQMVVTPVVEAGLDKTLVGGCDCIIASYRGYDKLKRFDLELDIGVLEPGLIEMLTGGTAIVSGGSPIGVWWPDESFQCETPAQPNVAFEAWQDLWEDDHIAAAPFPYVHWVWPSTFWQIGAHTLQNDFLQPKLTGFTRGNNAWGAGIYADQPESAGPLGGWFYSATLPTGACGYGTHSIT